jgi:hypothetical protein
MAYSSVPLETSDRGGVSLPVTLQDQTTDMLDLLFLQTIADGLTLASVTDTDLRTMTLTAGHGLSTAANAGHIIELGIAATGRFTQAEILDVTGDVITVDRQIGQAFPTATTLVSVGNPNMAVVDGSSTPVIFTIKPLPGQSGDITRIMMASQSSNASDISTFGGAGALTVGLTLRVKRADGTFKNLFNYKSNFDLILHGFDVEPFDPRGGNTINGYAGRTTFAGQDKHGVAVRLDGDFFEELQVVVNEAMDSSASGNTAVFFIAEGSELQGE